MTSVCMCVYVRILHNSKTIGRRILKFWIFDCSNMRMEASPFGYSRKLRGSGNGEGGLC
ncbi:hypothetical protein O3M35_011453 [Rhynocoris fuscipes]|uniref:Uncharacterized protein n=1 Tax=Rhynocoris fuscipes TaxID=488301 RepID=A0AAW1D0T6_9HEMI